MKHYIGFLKINMNKMLYFTSDKSPTKHTHWYFGKVLGPYSSESEARNTMGVLKRGYGYIENPSKEFAVTKSQALAMTRKVLDIADRVVNSDRYYRKNPDSRYHETRFIKHMKELNKMKVGSCQYMITLAKAHEHVRSLTAEDVLVPKIA